MAGIQPLPSGPAASLANSPSSLASWPSPRNEKISKACCLIPLPAAPGRHTPGKLRVCTIIPRSRSTLPTDGNRTPQAGHRSHGIHTGLDADRTVQLRARECRREVFLSGQCAASRRCLITPWFLHSSTRFPGPVPFSLPLPLCAGQPQIALLDRLPSAGGICVYICAFLLSHHTYT